MAIIDEREGTGRLIRGRRGKYVILTFWKEKKGEKKKRKEKKEKRRERKREGGRRVSGREGEREAKRREMPPLSVAISSR